jgi:DNA-binding Lrp family transcriptional regulator
LDQSQLASFDRALVLATQAGLPLVSRPYELLAQQLGVTPEEIKQRLAQMLATGKIRRIGAVPNHYAIGYTANGMTVWDVDDSQVDRLGALVGALESVTHCYRRPRSLPEWRYNLFAMVHGHSREEVAAKAQHIQALLGPACAHHTIIYSSQILKKTGIRIGGES